jgi:hypothetical protein
MHAGSVAAAVLASLPVLLRVEARRPATWIALAIAAVAAVACRSGVGWPAVPLACGGLAGLAAVGDLPLIAANPGSRVACLLARVAWPLAGAIGGWMAAARIVASASQVPAAVALGVVLVAAARVIGGFVAATAAAWHAPDPFAGVPLPDAEGHRSVFGHGWHDRVAMAAALAAMAVCYFLVPEAAAWYAVIVAAVFVLLTVPAATRGPAVADEAARSLLARTMPGRPVLPGTSSASLRAIAVSASVLAWPALVAAVLRFDLVALATGPMAAIALLATLATTTACVTLITGRWGGSGDTARALVVAGVALLTISAHAARYPAGPVCAVGRGALAVGCQNRC